jgi:ABC-2 type transport system ATP-binding protein
MGISCSFIQTLYYYTYDLQTESVMANTILEIHNLVKRYGSISAVNDISFQVFREEIFGILGPNGAGKTTTLEIIETLRSADSGRILLNGVDVQKNPQDVKQMIGVQLQAASFFDKLSLEELLSLFGEFYGQRVEPSALLQQVELQDRAKSTVSQLSGGQKQRFSIAAALVNEPQLLFLDEPTTGLDPQARRHLWEVIRNIRKEGKTIVLTTHYMEEAEELCDRVAIMDYGKIIALAPPLTLVDELLQSGFSKPRIERLATLEDVFLQLTGHSLREEQ